MYSVITLVCGCGVRSADGLRAKSECLWNCIAFTATVIMFMFDVTGQMIETCPLHSVLNSWKHWCVLLPASCSDTTLCLIDCVQPQDTRLWSWQHGGVWGSDVLCSRKVKRLAADRDDRCGSVPVEFIDRCCQWNSSCYMLWIQVYKN